MPYYLKENKIELLKNGKDYFASVIHSIKQARQNIFVEAYIFSHDVTGIKILTALKEAVKRNVEVYLLLDGFGSRDLSQEVIDEIKTSKIHFLFYHPKISPYQMKRISLRRLHRKMFLIDHKIAYVGGINIIDDMNVPNGKAPRIDYAAQLQGPAVHFISQSMVKLWKRVSWSHLEKSYVPKHIHKNIASYPNGTRLNFIERDNFRHRQDIEKAYLDAIQNAKDEILIANAYFIPGKKFERALIEAARRGVSVTLLLKGEMDYFLSNATRAFYGKFLKEGIGIFEYTRSFMHSKVAVIDEAWSTVGSSNIDPFSLLLAREANIVVFDKSFASQLKRNIKEDIRFGGTEILLKDWDKAHLIKRLKARMAYLFIRLSLGVANI
jgi:cardiolipin synthase